MFVMWAALVNDNIQDCKSTYYIGMFDVGEIGKDFMICYFVRWQLELIEETSNL